MFSDGGGNRRGFPGLGRLKQLGRLKDWAGKGLRKLGGEPVFRDYEDTLRRLLKGEFEDLSAEARREKVDQIVGLSAMAAMAMATAPIPFLELPVQMAMVRAIARVNGVKAPGRKVLWELVGALGGGIVMRQVMRMVPLVGPLPYLSRIYGSTWALGRVAHLFYSGEAPKDEEALRRMFEETASKVSAEQSERMRQGNLEAQLRYLDDLLERAVITPEEHRRKRDELLGKI